MRFHPEGKREEKEAHPCWSGLGGGGGKAPWVGRFTGVLITGRHLGNRFCDQ